MEYTEARELLDSARSRENGKPIANNTRIFEREDHLAIRLHNTDIVKLEQSGAVELDSGGWLTVTTKERMNRYAPVRIGSEKGIWYCYLKSDPTVEWSSVDWDNPIPYFDGIRFSRTGQCLNGIDPAAFAEYKQQVAQIKKRIGAYARGFEAELVKGMPMPGPGDCWHCSMFERIEPGQTRGSSLPEKQGPDDHLEHHLEERYFVPTLAVNAMREAGYQDTGIYLILEMDPDSQRMGGDRFRKGTVARVIREYLKKRLLPDPPQPESEKARMSEMAEQPELFAD